MFYVKSMSKYTAQCENFKNGLPQTTDFFLQATFNEFDELCSIVWGPLATPLNRGQLVAVLQAIPIDEEIEITTKSQ